MNKVVIVGRLTKDVELKTTPQGVSVCAFTIAVNRRFKNANGEYEADFINCVAWRATAEFISKYFNKGRMLGISGSIQTRSWEKDGERRYVTEVMAEEAYFVDSKSDDASAEGTRVREDHTEYSGTQTDMFSQGFSHMPMPDDDDLPF